MAQVVETFSASFFLANKKLVMVKKIDNFKIYKKAFVGLTAGVLIVGILGGVHISVFVKFNTIICIIRLRVLVLLKN